MKAEPCTLGDDHLLFRPVPNALHAIGFLCIIEKFTEADGLISTFSSASPQALLTAYFQ